MMRLLWVIVLSTLIIGCTGENMKKVKFSTEDSVTIVGNLYTGNEKGILLLHMMPATKESWNDFALELNKKGFTVLAIDMRGHGESIAKGNSKLDFRAFSDSDHQASILDVEAGVKYLNDIGITTYAIAGASIGANLALQYQSEHKEIMKTILLSPGLNYRGVITIPMAAKLSKEQQVFFIAGSKDGRSAGAADVMARQIAEKLSGKYEMKIIDTSSHGTDMLNKEINKELIAWLE